MCDARTIHIQSDTPHTGDQPRRIFLAYAKKLFKRTQVDGSQKCATINTNKEKICIEQKNTIGTILRRSV